MSNVIAVINAGSSSIKFALYEGVGAKPLYRGQIEGIGTRPALVLKNAEGEDILKRDWPAKGFDHRIGTREIISLTEMLLSGRVLGAVGHRVVHGGTRYAAPTIVDQTVLRELDDLVPLAPLHQPHNLAPIRAIAEQWPQLPQVACFDTAFHRGQAKVAQAFALPRSFWDEGVRRYGFHGLSYEFIQGEMTQIDPVLAKGRLVVAHLGNGASLCAIKGGRSVATTMGFTALDGLMMGTRCGAIDPGVLLYLMNRHGMNAAAIENLIYRRSGLLGVSGISSDMRELRASSALEAKEAIQLFVHRIVREIGSLVAVLGGVDAIVFTGGIGENDAATRREVAEGCAWLGLILDGRRNDAPEGRISAAGSSVAAFVIGTDEERMIARHTRDILATIAGES